MRWWITYGFGVALAAAAPSTIDPVKAFAYAPNAGWIHFRPTAADGVAVHLYHLSGKAYGANVGWVDFGDGTPGAGHLYSNASPEDMGVNHDGRGNLDGYAYSANIGWIVFGWASAADEKRARIDLRTGRFEGYAWSPNIGWIALGTDELRNDSLQVVDLDGDGIGDEWELAWFGDLVTADGTSDADGDGERDVLEYQADTRPLDAGDFLRLEIASAWRQPNGVEALLRWVARGSRDYRIETSVTLEPGSWVDSGLGTLPGNDEGREVLQVFPGEKRFFRLKALLPSPAP